MYNKKLLLYVSVVILLLAIVVHLQQKKATELSTEEESTEKNNENAVQEKEKNYGGGNIDSSSSVEQDTITDDEKKKILKSLSPRLKRMAVLAESSVHPVEFWGKVVDQYGEPLVAVDILYNAGGGYLGGGSGYGRLQTDLNGLFHITGCEGGSLNIIEMKKEGYQIVIPPQDSLFYSYKKYPDSLLWTEYTKDKPYIYHAWKYSDKLKEENLIHDECKVIFQSGGTEYAIDLFGAPKQRYREDLKKAQLKVQFYREPGSSKRTGGKWQLVLTALDGGIMRAESLYTNEAPISGYNEKVVLTNDDYQDGRYNNKVINFYVTIKEGTVFARLSIELYPYVQNDKGVIYAKYTINPTGERYLDTYDE